MKKGWKNFLKDFIIFTLTIVLTIIVIIVFAKLGNKSARVGTLVSIEQVGDQSLWRGIVTGNISTMGPYGLIEVVNPPDSSRIFTMRVAYHSFGPADYDLGSWKVGEEILFHKTAVNSADELRASMFSFLGLFFSKENWKKYEKTSPHGWMIANPPDRK
jgi:hypothetical protein